MSESSPADLAVAFRSMDRRLREALAPVHGDLSVAGGMIGELEQVVVAAARAAGTSTASSSAIATELESRPQDKWDDGDLRALRQHALDAGRLLRAIATAAEAAAD
ncbi:MAG: hypothetical protein AB7Q42_23160 [Acidimicrobiia bacterium]